ncbi:MAG: hypothetical protein TREMPRED_002910 [Tremellales sp. Tagirdzhanova-0007]|nr:MAG: hypothetical protein TREMPRED_002910 [Tremellales sp. Tagirdzhanova-0007]
MHVKLSFSVIFGGSCYIAAARYTNEDTARWAERLGSGRWWRRGQEQPTDREIARAKQIVATKDAQTTLNTLPARLSFLPRVLATPILRIYVSFREWTLNTPSARLAPMILVAGMAVVFAGWKVKRFEPWMKTWWLHRPVLLGGSAISEWANPVTLITSVLSHQSLPHFAFNSIALVSFGSSAYLFLSSPHDRTQSLSSSSHTPHFLAFLLCAGLTSSLASHLWTNLFRLPRLLRSLSSPARLSSTQALAAHQAILPSLGASGAIYAALTMTACAYPDSQVGIIFIPFIRMPIGLGVTAIVALDLVGLIRGWRLFDHVAHLGGAFFGIVYYQYGRQLWVWTRRQLGAREKDSGFD